MNPFEGIATLLIGVYRTGKLQAWARLLASCSATAFITFFATFGLTVSALAKGPPVVALVMGLATASLAMALSVLGLWLRSPLTRNIPLLYPAKIEAARLQELVDDGTVYVPNAQRKD